MNVLIATHGRPDLLQRTLESLACVRRPPQLQRIIVVENGSDAGARAVCADFAQRMPLDYYNRAEPGKSRALQWAIDHVIHQGLIVFFDDDVRLSPGILEAYASAAAANGPRCFFGGPFDVDCDDRPPQWLYPYLPLSAKGWDPANPEAEMKHTRFLGFNYAAFAESIRAVGGFNPDIGPGARHAGTEGNPTGQETDMQNRLLNCGYQPVWVADARVWHYVPGSRCNAAWTLHRAYRAFITRAINDEAAKPSTGPRLFGVPRWKLREYVRAWLAARLGRFVRDPQHNFQLRLREARLRGYLVGMKDSYNGAAPQGPRDPGGVDHGSRAEEVVL